MPVGKPEASAECQDHQEGHQDAQTLDDWRQLFARCGLRIANVLPDQWPRQRWWQLLPGQRPQPGRRERVAGSLLPMRWCNELVFVLERQGADG